MASLPRRKARRARPQARAKAKALAAEAVERSAVVAKYFKTKAMATAMATTSGVEVQTAMGVAGSSDENAAQATLRSRVTGITLAAIMLQILLVTLPRLI